MAQPLTKKMPQIHEATVTVSDSLDVEVDTYGENKNAVVTVTNSEGIRAKCKGENCTVSVVKSKYSRSACEGYNCTALGDELVGYQGAALKITCEGEKCEAICRNSANCTAYCKGKDCVATCLHNTVCAATCDGVGCGTVCRPAENGTCDDLKLPKMSICENCLFAPTIYDWQVCKHCLHSGIQVTR